MSGSQEFAPNLEALASEELSTAELRVVLERLSVAEFGGSDHPTVAAVCEATGASLIVIGRILAEIRQQNLKELFGARIDRQERLLLEHERKLSALDSRSIVPPPVVSDYFAGQERDVVHDYESDSDGNYKMLNESRIARAFITAFVLFLFIAYVWIRTKSGGS